MTVAERWLPAEFERRSIVLGGALFGPVAVIEARRSDRCVFDYVHLYFDTTSLLVQLALT